MKKVLILEDSRKVGFGGGQKGSLEVISSLVDHFEVTATDSLPDSIFATRSRELLGKPVYRLRSFGSDVGGNKGSFRIGFLELVMYPFLTAWNVIGLFGLIRREGMNSRNAILYAPLKKTLVPAWVLSLVTRIPFVYHARTVDDPTSVYFKILKFILKRARSILCVSQAVASNLEMPQCQVLYNAVQTQEGATAKRVPALLPSSDKPKFVVAAFASLLHWKGLEYLIRAARLVRNPEDVEVRIYGKGPLENELRELCSSNCKMLGFAENVNEILASEVHVVCTPSIFEEAFGRVPMEGNSFGIPAIVTNIGAQAEITIDAVTGYHVPPKDAQAIAEAIDHMLANPDHYHLLSQQAIEHSKSFDLAAHRLRVRSIFESIN
ncbi:glycosyltransferase family 4 protein [Rubripirellula amarantea]|uniref:GDP-mannose-dependent alpha-(1-2)-phosphatidylinositol mannosyltransferase n=1 Tax=Rubripirellula amarantea TaxID=2527999 RepID=A0A5C5WBZ3_9BACT|nr:glycosyltransferase family 4 protein [Rubripirellula amarantea]MDA8744863.1 glycosyltransferase family 4 protein [Rubripirellula amarantea]TWT48164.1 GDP-mannose-dependent alpha-(1-2)-phosphatidylinositol mannosyltransferase [Rubripirellula amarantea]